MKLGATTEKRLMVDVVRAKTPHGGHLDRRQGQRGGCNDQRQSMPRKSCWTRTRWQWRHTDGLLVEGSTLRFPFLHLLPYSRYAFVRPLTRRHWSMRRRQCSIVRRGCQIMGINLPPINKPINKPSLSQSAPSHSRPTEPSQQPALASQSSRVAAQQPLGRAQAHVQNQAATSECAARGGGEVDPNKIPGV